VWRALKNSGDYDMADDKDVVGKGAKAAKGALGAVGGLLGGAAAAAANAAKAAGDAAGDAVSGVAGAVGDVASGVTGAVGDAVSGVTGAVGDVAGGAVDAGKGLIGGVTGAVGDVAGGAVDAAKGAVSGVTGAVGGAVSGVTDTVGNLASGAVDAGKGLIGGVTGAVGDVAGGVSGAVGGAVSGVTGAVGNVAGGAADLAGKGVGAAVGVGAAALGTAGALAGGLVGGVGKGIGAVSGGVSDAVGTAGSYTGVGRLDGDEEKVDRTGGGWLVPLLGLIGITGLAFVGAQMFFGKKTEEVAAVAPAAPAVPAWLTSIGETLKGKFAWLGLGGTAAQVIASGTAPDQAGKDGALADLQAALTASTEGKDARIIDNITVTGSADTPVGAALAALGANPDVAACQKAFNDTMAGRTINFTTGSAVINDNSRSLLNALTGIATACKTHTIEVGGHTDTVGLPENNQRLSQSRAEAVKAFWVDAGVAATTLSAVGYGEGKLKEATADQTENAANRRIEFTVTDMAAAAAPAAPEAK
jgi:outer membrane protein OmpA-like peptidoglycan-associated protein